MKYLTNIKRIDNDINRTHAWFVQVQRNKHVTMKMFSDNIYGGKDQALQAAINFHAQLLAAVPSYDYQIWLRTRLRRNNTSGIPGVSRYNHLANANTGRRVIFWLAFWIDEEGRSRKRKFSVLRYGENRARELAIAERERQLKRVCLIKSRKQTST